MQLFFHGLFKFKITNITSTKHNITESEGVVKWLILENWNIIKTNFKNSLKENLKLVLLFILIYQNT